MNGRRLVEVALPIPLFRNFVYALDESFEREVNEGSRLLVPLRGGKEVGICVATDVSPQPKSTSALKKVLAVPDERPAIGADILSLCKWISEYYVVPLGLCLRAALPAAMSSTAVFEPARKTHRVIRVRGDIPSLLERERAFSRAVQQRALFELLESLGGQATADHLQRTMDFSPSVLRGLVQRGLVSVVDKEISRDPFFGRDPGPPPNVEPTPAQRKAISAILAGEPGSVFLLQGVTGSGKTLVYIETLRQLLADGRTGIVLVPEIALTPQTVDRFRAVFGNQVAVLHSALSQGERYDAWLSVQRGERRIVIGARSAIFAPLENLGAIIVDEEHEGTYKQNEAPRYHAREVAVVRARQAGAVIVLASATPSLESWHNAQNGKYHLLTLPDRVTGAPMPDVSAVDMRVRMREYDERTGNFGVVFSPELEHALEKCLEQGEQSILLLNRRGHSSFLQCRNCGEVVACPNCSISLTYHSVTERLLCHYCQHSQEVTGTCGNCAGETVRQRGVGTQQVERLLGERFPTARIARMDMDTTSEKWSHARILDRVARKEIDILLGTQMIAKGLDFPGITVVGVVDADVGINLPDFRAGERSFQLMSQVAGRAGRGRKKGEVFIQTRSPNHHAVQRAIEHDFFAFANDELGTRTQPGYPPFVRLTNVLFSGTDAQETASLAVAAADWIKRLLKKRAIKVRLVGPAPCPIQRIKTRWRWHLLLKSRDSAAMTRLLRYFVEHYKAPDRSSLRISVDRDPVALL